MAVSDRSALTAGPTRSRATRAMLFTDIEGSTPLLERLGDAYADVLRRHYEILTEAVSVFGGVEHGTEGDSLFASFDSAGDAVAASVRAQLALVEEAWPDGVRMRVRMGVHIGEIIDTEAGLVGMAIHHAARIANAAHGGQIVASVAVAALVDPLPDPIGVVRLGRYRVRDVGVTELFQVTHPGLEDRFAQPRGIRPLTGNVELSPTALIGREVELVEVSELLGSSRLVTLTGSGGVGKTRLACELAERLSDRFDDGVWLVQLASVADPDTIPAVIVSTLGLKHDPARQPIDVLIDVLSDRSTVLVLDNCEHVLDASAALADRLMRGCKQVVVLATSREPLRVGGETVYRVPSLACPLPDASGERIVQTDAVRLLVERAGQRGVTMTNDEPQLRSIAAVCRRLDGMPLAIELAAARLPSMSVEQLHDQLSDRFRLLTGGSRSALPRHQTLRALIDWSYDALADNDRLSLERLSVFSGGFVLEDALALLVRCGVRSWEAMDSITSLVDKSLIQAESSGKGMRYRLLETVRQYAAERLVDRGADAAVAARDAQVDVFADLVESWVQMPGARDDREKRERAEAEVDNFRAAMSFALERPTARERCAVIARGCMRVWYRDGSLGDELRCALAALVDDDSISDERRCDSLVGASAIALNESVPAAIELLERAVVLATSIGDDRRECYVRLWEAEARWRAGQIDDALEIVEATLMRGRVADDGEIIAWGLELRAVLLAELGSPPATSDFEEAAAHYERVGDHANRGVVLGNMAVGDLAAGNFEQALARTLDARRAFVEDAGGVGVTQAYYNVGLAQIGLGDHDAARDEFLTCLDIDLSRGDWLRVAYDVMAAALVAWRTEMGEIAVNLHAAAAALMEHAGAQFERFLIDWVVADLAALQERLGAATFDVATAAGRALRRHDAVALARSVLEPVPAIGQRHLSSAP